MKNKAAGCLFGMAYGDSLASRTEFIRSIDEIYSRFPPSGPIEPEGNPARVTDDTQMALAVGEALLLMDPSDGYSVSLLEPTLRHAFVGWMWSPDNDRSPGMTCLSACVRLQMDMSWQQATVEGSKGCGANMRVQPVGLLKVDDVTRAGLAQFQAAMTHGHPTALAASDLTAFAIACLAAGAKPATLPRELRAYAEAQHDIYHMDWLGHLWERPAATTPEAFIGRGWDECLGVLDNLDTALIAADRVSDPCIYTGEGWIAEEAFGTGLLCFLLFPDDPVAAIRRAAVTTGDSDSIACLTGAFAGACHGFDAWPAEWYQRIEYRDRLQRLADAWD